MGNMVYRAILVTCWNKEHIEEARGKALDMFGPVLVTKMHGGVINDERSFCIMPENSKRGWPQADEHDKLRDEFCDWLTLEWQRGNSYCLFSYLEHSHDDERFARVIRSNVDVETDEEAEDE